MAPRSVLRACLCAALLACTACSSPPKGIRRLPDAHKIDVALASAAQQQGDWSLAASYWYEIYLRGGETEARACVETARALLELREVKSARNLLKEGLAKHPDDPDLLESYANVLVTSGFRRAAEPYFERALDLDPDRRSVLLELGRVRLGLKLFTAAAELLERRIALGGGDAETWGLLGRARRGSGDALGAFAAYVRAFEIGERRAEQLAYAATVYLEMDRDERTPEHAETVETWLRRAIESEPRCAEAYAGLACLEEELGRRERALDNLRTAVELAPEDTEIVLRLAAALERCGAHLEAADIVKRRMDDLVRTARSETAEFERLKERYEELRPTPSGP